MQLASQLSASNSLRNFVAPQVLTGSGHPAIFRQLPSGMGLEEVEKQDSQLFDLLQQALGSVDLQLQSKCIAFDIQLATNERVLAETSSFLQLLETLIGLAAETAPTGACITIAAQRVQNQLAITVKEESSPMEKSAAERMLQWFTGYWPKAELNPGKVATCRRLVEQHGGEMTIHTSRNACLIARIPVIYSAS